MSLSLITDRTDADYQSWLTLSRIAWADMTDVQKAKWSVPMKGAYNYTDLNRVGEAMLTLQALIASCGYTVSVDVRTDWTAGEWPSDAEMSSYVQSIANIRGVLSAASTTPATPSSMDDGTVVIWNNIEQILLDVERLIYSLSHTADLGWALGIAHTGLYSFDPYKYPALIMADSVAYGTTTQNGTPAPDASVNLVNTIDARTYQYKKDGVWYKITLPTMRSVGSVADTWDSETGLFTQNIGCKVLAGTESVSTGSSYVLISFAQISPTPKASAIGLCSHFPYHANTSVLGFWSGSSGFAFNFAGQTAFTDATTFKAFLAAQYAAGTPVTVYYQLATPVTQTITPEVIE